ncbi:MAG: hypothetical protein IKP00_16495 [Victivallales bacterium]|nr:hypothetical protein [Victivallales bacterium]
MATAATPSENMHNCMDVQCHNGCGDGGHAVGKHAQLRGCAMPQRVWRRRPRRRKTCTTAWMCNATTGVATAATPLENMHNCVDVQRRCNDDTVAHARATGG